MTIPHHCRRIHDHATRLSLVTAVGLILLGPVLIGAVPGHAETIRGPVVDVLTLEDQDATPEPVVMRSEDVLGVTIGSSLRFVEGIQFEVSIPPVAREIGGGLALYLYAAPTADLPSGTAGAQSRGNAGSNARADGGSSDDFSADGVLQFEGTELFFLPMPARNRILVRVPLREDHGFRQTADVYVTRPAATQTVPLLAQIVPVMKGLPERAMRARFRVTATPLIRNIGALRLFLLHPDGTLITDPRDYDLEVRLDGGSLATAGENAGGTAGDTSGGGPGGADGDDRGDDRSRLGEEITLLPGLHRVAVRSEEFENESLTFGVERGRVTDLRVELQRPRSTLRVDAPEPAELFVNGERVGEGRRSLSLPPGEHTLLFRLGDYSVSRKIVIEPKQDYEISLSLDILVRED
jgi:hypothetical protein